MEKCFCCGRSLKNKPHAVADTKDGQLVFVGRDCARQIVAQAAFARARGVENPGWLHKSGGPSLFPWWPFGEAVLKAQDEAVRS